MSTAYLIAKAEERRRAERSAEFALRAPLHLEKYAEPPDWRDADRRYDEAPGYGEESARTLSAPDWTMNY